MTQLRPVSPRPELLVGDDSARIESPDKTQVGRSGPLGRERLVYALPTNGTGPVQLAPGSSVQGDGALLADPNNNVVGFTGPVWVHRMLFARFTENTRRLG